MSQDSIILMIKGLFVLMALGALYLVALRPLVRLLREKPDIELLTPTLPDRLVEEEELQIPEKLGTGPNRQQMLEAAKADPRNTAMMVSRWLKEKK